MSKIHRRRPSGYRFALGALDAAERLRQVGSREAVQQMVYDQLRILGANPEDHEPIDQCAWPG